MTTKKNRKSFRNSGSVHGIGLVKAALVCGLGVLTAVQPETAIVTIPLILGIGKGK